MENLKKRTPMERFNINITPDKVTETNNYSVSSMEDFENNLQENISSSSLEPGLVPPGLIYYNENLTSIVFERPPTTMDLYYYKQKRHGISPDKVAFNVQIPIPWQIYIAQFDESGYIQALKVFFSYSQVKSFNVNKDHSSYCSIKTYNKHSVYQTGMLNIYDTDLVCIDGVTNNPNGKHLEGRINTAYTAFWQTNFNYDLPQHLQNLASHVGRLKSTPKKVIEKMKSDYSHVYEYWATLSHFDIMDDSFGFFIPASEEIPMPDYFKSTNLSNKLLQKVPILI